MKAIHVALTNGEVIELDVESVETISFVEAKEVTSDAISEPIAEEQPVVEEIVPEPERVTVTVSNEGVKVIPDTPVEEIPIPNAPVESAEPVEIPNAPVQEEVVVPVAEVPAEPVTEPAEEPSVLSTIVGMATAEIPAEPTEEVKEAIPEDAPASEPVAEAPAEEVPKEEPKKEQPAIEFIGA